MAAVMQQPSDRPSILSYRHDVLDFPEEGAVEVVITLADGRERWCYFFTPERMSIVGDWVKGTQVRVHLGTNHMIVVSELSAGIIASVLNELESSGLLFEHTRPVGGNLV